MRGQILADQVAEVAMVLDLFAGGTFDEPGASAEVFIELSGDRGLDTGADGGVGTLVIPTHDEVEVCGVDGVAVEGGVEVFAGNA